LILLPLDIRRSGDTGKTWRVARRKAVVGTVHDLVFLALIPLTVLLDTFANLLVEFVAPAVSGFGHFSPPQRSRTKFRARVNSCAIGTPEALETFLSDKAAFSTACAGYVRGPA
jgi:hypothetical protein